MQGSLPDKAGAHAGGARGGRYRLREGRDAAASGFRARTTPPGGGRAARNAKGTPRRTQAAPRGEGAGPAPGRKPTGGRRAHPAWGGACRRPKGPSRVSRAARRRVERALPVCQRRRRGRSGPRTPCGRGGGKGADWIVRRRQVLTDRPSRRASPSSRCAGHERPHRVRSWGRAGGGAREVRHCPADTRASGDETNEHRAGEAAARTYQLRGGGGAATGCTQPSALPSSGRVPVRCYLLALCRKPE